MGTAPHMFVVVGLGDLRTGIWLAARGLAGTPMRRPLDARGAEQRGRLGVRAAHNHRVGWFGCGQPGL